MGFWDKVKDRRKQQRRDTTQDDEIKQLKSRVDSFEKQGRGRDRDERSVSRSRADSDWSSDEVGYSFEKSGALIRREFDDGYQRYGQKFAVGDVVTENKLQAQVIALQQTVINVLQDAVYHGRQLTRADMAKLIAASNAARDGSLDALRDQRQRLIGMSEVSRAPPPLALEPPPLSRYAPTEGSVRPHPGTVVSARGPATIEPPRFAPTALSMHARDPTESPTRASSSSTAVDPGPLYCRYSLDLQYRNKPLASNFAPGRKCDCPACGVRLNVAPDEVWAIGKRTSRWVPDGRYEREVVEELEYLVSQRFVVKSHTPEGEFACLFGTKHRDGDIVCPTIDILIKHIGKAHDIAELDKEPDFDVRTRPVPLALPAP